MQSDVEEATLNNESMEEALAWCTGDPKHMEDEELTFSAILTAGDRLMVPTGTIVLLATHEEDGFIFQAPIWSAQLHGATRAGGSILSMATKFYESHQEKAWSLVKTAVLQFLTDNDGKEAA